jgi:hypothetical protein
MRMGGVDVIFYFSIDNKHFSGGPEGRVFFGDRKNSPTGCFADAKKTPPSGRPLKCAPKNSHLQICKQNLRPKPTTHTP